jgi:hypothetical protein
VMDTTLSFIGSVSQVGSRDSMRLALATGDYYLVVADHVGEAMRYSLCISVRFACIPPILPGETVPQNLGPAAVRFRAVGPDARRPDGRPFSVPAGSALSPSRSPFRRP